jgi:hypothetical protein
LHFSQQLFLQNHLWFVGCCFEQKLHDLIGKGRKKSIFAPDFFKWLKQN